MQTVTVRVEKNYGVNHLYPVCDRAKSFAAIANTKTLTGATISQIESIGFRVEIDYSQQMEAIDAVLAR